MTVPKGRVQECPEKSGVHMGAADNTGNKKVDKGRGMAQDGIEPQRHHPENATASDTEEIPAVIQRRSQRWLCSQSSCAHMAPGAFLPNAASGGFMPGISFPHGWTCCCLRCTGQPG